MADLIDPALHRGVAADTFNRSWDLIDAGHRSDDDEAELLGLVFASWWHWRQVGTVENNALADHHAAKALALVGDGALSLRFAGRALRTAEAEGWSDWRLVACHEGMARAHAALGDADERDRHLRMAKDLLDGLGDEDAAVLAPQLAEIPGWPPAVG